jgi:hypothetical protein
MPGRAVRPPFAMPGWRCVQRRSGYVAGLLAGCIIFAAGALVALITINARVSPAGAAGH